jgi:hypothetical protein
MPRLLDRPPRASPLESAAQRLRATMAAVRLSFTWFGTRRTLNQEQTSQAADTFGAEEAYVSARKKLLDTSHPAFKAVTGVRTRAIQYWKGTTLPYPEPGVRLIRQDDLQVFSVQLTTFQAELAEAVERLIAHYQELQSAARQRLGRLFNPADYPADLEGLFAINFDFPSVEPPAYLRQLSPQLYEQEAARVAARFDDAIRLAEEAFIEELSKLVSHLSERLAGNDDGKPKIFRDSAIEILQEFFGRFRHLNIRSNQQLDELVAQIQRITSGVQPQALRDDQPLRQRVGSQLAGVQSVLDGLLVDRPRRALQRRPR